MEKFDQIAAGLISQIIKWKQEKIYKIYKWNTLLFFVNYNYRLCSFVASKSPFSSRHKKLRLFRQKTGHSPVISVRASQFQYFSFHW